MHPLKNKQPTYAAWEQMQKMLFWKGSSVYFFASIKNSPISSPDNVCVPTLSQRLFIFLLPLFFTYNFKHLCFCKLHFLGYFLGIHIHFIIRINHAFFHTFFYTFFPVVFYCVFNIPFF